MHSFQQRLSFFVHLGGLTFCQSSNERSVNALVRFDIALAPAGFHKLKDLESPLQRILSCNIGIALNQSIEAQVIRLHLLLDHEIQVGSGPFQVSNLCVPIQH